MRRQNVQVYDVAFLLDTDIVIHLRDLDPTIYARLKSLPGPFAISVVTLAELESGVYREPAFADERRRSLERTLRMLNIVNLEPSVARAYGKIVAASGFSRTRVLDRLIAATAIVHGLTLVTINGPDFRDIPALQLQVWPAPAQ